MSRLEQPRDRGSSLAGSAAWIPGGLVAVTLFVTGPSRADGVDGAPLRFTDAIRLALSRNERARITELNVAAAEAGVEKARAAFLPTVTVSGNDTFRPSPAERDGALTQTRNAATGAATLSQPLINVPSWPLYSQSKRLLEAQEAQTVDDKRLLSFDAAHAFMSALAADAVVRAAQRRADSSSANLADTTARAQAGLTSTNDATRAQIDLYEAGRELESDRGSLQNAYVQLSFVIDANVTGGVVAPEETLAAARRPLPNVEDLANIAMSRRPDLVAKRRTADAAHDFADEPPLRIIPALGVNAQVLALTNPASTSRWNDETLGATLTWTLYDAGVRYADKHQRDANATIADLDVDALVRSVGADVRSAVATLQGQQAAYRQAEQAVTAARQSADETSALYKQGLAKAIELVDANDTRFLEEVNDASAEYSMAQAYLNLRQALGLDPLGTEFR